MPFLGEGEDLGLGHSITESTMMQILHAAMDRAQERVQSRGGALERLHEQSKFLELAIMQLDGCLEFIHLQTEPHRGFVLEQSHEKEIDDLGMIRDRLRRRLESTDHAISKMDGELGERSEAVARLSHELEKKDRELETLRAHLWIGSEGNGDGGEFSELKNTVDEQVWSIKQKLEDRRRSISKMNNPSPSSSMNLEPYLESMEEAGTHLHLEEMGSDMDILKQTFDLAFGRMHRAIDLSGLGPSNQQWRWSTERDVMWIVVKGFVEELLTGQKDDRLVQKSHETLYFPPVEFQHLLVSFENRIQEKLVGFNSRLEGFKCKLNQLVRKAALFVQKDSVYRKGFLRRCENLQMAEAEVDLLGDQVDGLLDLMVKIYSTLNYHAPVLQQHFRVSDVLKSIENELTGGGVA